MNSGLNLANNSSPFVTAQNSRISNKISNIRNRYTDKGIDYTTTTNTEKPTLNEVNNATNIFAKYKPGENIRSDGNCGIYAVCNDNEINRITSVMQIFYIGLNELSKY